MSLLFDFEGSGVENQSRDEVEESIEVDLSRNGWADRSAAIVVNPEIEAWVWSDSCEVDVVLNWQRRQPDVRSTIKNMTAFWEDGLPKPQQPKEALRWALRHANRPKPFSSSIFKDLATRVSLTNCVDPSFGKFRGTLRNWFGN